MMSYRWLQDGSRLLIEWSSGWLRAGALLTGIAAVAAGAWLAREGWNGARPGAAKRWGGIGLLVFGLLAAVSSARPPLTRWELTRSGMRIEGLSGTRAISWGDLSEVRLEPSSRRLDKSALVLEDRDGRKTWLPLGWLLRTHRRELVVLLAQNAPAAMAPVSGDDAYLRSLQDGWHPSDEEGR